MDSLVRDLFIALGSGVALFVVLATVALDNPFGFLMVFMELLSKIVRGNEDGRFQQRAERAYAEVEDLM